MEAYLDKNVLFTGDDARRVKNKVKDFITLLSSKGYKVFLLDAFWSEERYRRFVYSRYRDEIERRYHIKLSVNDFLQQDNVFEYMKDRNINILKVKSITGYMSAAELFPVIISKINQDITQGEKAYVLINDFVLQHLSGWEFNNIYEQIDGRQIKFIFLSIDQPVVKAFWKVIDENIIIN